MPAAIHIPAVLFCLFLAVTADPALAQSQPAPQKIPPRPPPPLIVTPAGQQPIRLTRTVLDAEVHGGLVDTRLELTFLNPNPRTLEGELQFPLHPGQTLTGFALEMADGTMMPAVPVPKARGRQAFEDTTRVRVDPALLEQSEGNRFRLRIYPLASQQPRRVRLDISESLASDARQQVALQLPLDLGVTVPEALAIHLRLPAMAAADLRLGSVLQGASVRTQGGETLVDFAASKLPLPPGQLDATAVHWRAQPQDSVVSDRSEGQAWFHAELAAPADARRRTPPDPLLLIWDASGSGAARDHGRELQLLDRVFRWEPSTQVVLRVVRDVAEPDVTFEVRDGDWHALRRALETMAYDGASNASLWQPAGSHGPDKGLALLFSDGLGNWGEPARAVVEGVTAYAVSAGSGANLPWLRRWAEAHAGRLLDLSALTAGAAFDSLADQNAVVDHVDGAGFDQLVLESRHPEGGRVRLAGHFTGDRAHLDVVWRLPSGSLRHQALELQAPPAAADRGSASAADGSGTRNFAARRWAELRIAELAAEPALHHTEISTLGERFGLVTSETSLIVLENLNDFVRFGVQPPEGPLRVRYLAQQHDQESGRQQQQRRHLDELASRFEDYAAWWARDFPKDTPRPWTSKSGERSGGPGALADRPAAAPPGTPAPMPAPPARPGDRQRDGAAAQRGAEAATDARSAQLMVNPVLAAPALNAMKSAVVTRAAQNARADDGVVPDANPPRDIDVSLAPWSPDTASQRRLRDASAKDRYAVYLDERPRAARSPAFYLDAAQVFQEHGEIAMALRVLSNLAEIDAGNRALLRILAYRLQQLGQPAEALRQLQRVSELAPDEPQSWRDLGLAQAANGHWQEAVDALWRTASGVWSPRFADIDLIALSELNAIAAAHSGVDLAAVDPRLRRNFPLDLRVALSWDADNTDVDLWVLDPNGQWTSFQSPLSYQGGHLSHDCTQGYGPEVFSLRTAKPGHYEVRAHYYGSRMQTVEGYPTLMLHLSQGFGTTREAGRDIVVRLEQVKDDVLIGSFDVGTGGETGKH